LVAFPSLRTVIDEKGWFPCGGTTV
jgi:hypothetical protein